MTIRQRISIPEDFPWCSDGFRATHNAWLLEMFGYRDDDEGCAEEQAGQVVTDESGDTKPAATKPAVMRSKRKSRRVTYEHEGSSYDTLGELLDNMEGVFDSLKFPDDKKFSWLSKRDMKALRAIGVHIPSPWLLDTAAKIGPVDSYPTIMAISLGSRSTGQTDAETGRINPSFAFAIRQPSLPPSVELAEGIPYVFGECFPDRETGKNLWIAMYLTVRRDGEVTICRNKQMDTERVKHKVRSGYGRFTTICHMRSVDQRMVMPHDGRNSEFIKQWTTAIFVNMFNWWIGRGSRWNVSVKRGDERLTFGIEPENTKLFFANRDKSIKTPSGQTKRIIHYVHEHDRVLEDRSTTVREHIRGLREFKWNDSNCVVTAPKFHKAALSSTFTLAPEFKSEIGGASIGIHKLAQLLAQIEDCGTKRTHTRIGVAA